MHHVINFFLLTKKSITLFQFTDALSNLSELFCCFGTLSLFSELVLMMMMMMYFWLVFLSK